MSELKFEICANSVQSCIEAQKGGADRVELCAGIPEGGTTPSYGEILIARKHLSIKLHVIIRPRGGDFLYSPTELEIMENDIINAKKLGADGVVIGCLNSSGNINIEFCKKLISVTKGMSITFHRAFDCCQNQLMALEQIIDMGCERILTSGGYSTAEEGIMQLKILNKAAHGRIKIMAGCGVNQNNIAKIHKNTDIKEFHFSARETFRSKMQFQNPKIYMGLPGIKENEITETTSSKVKKIVKAISESNFLGI